MFKRIIYRDPNSNAGGAAPAAAPAQGGSPSPASPSSTGSAPAAKSGGAVFQSFQEGLAKALTKKDPASSQPPSDGKATPAAATASEGEDEGQDVDSKEPVTTAEPGDETAPDEEQQGDDSKGWTEEEQKELKAHGQDKLPFGAEARGLLKSFREARAEKDRLATSNANMVTRNSQLEAALQSGDAKALQELGYDLKLDQRTPEKMIEEIEAQFNGVKDAFAPLIQQLADSNPEVAGLIRAAAQKVLKGYNDKAAIIAKEQEKESWQSEVLEKVGHKPNTKDHFAKIKGQAETNLTALAQQDPDAPKYFKELEAATKQGGALHALGISLAKGYGLSKETAKMMNDIGKGLYFQRNMKTILEGERKKWDKDRDKRAMTHGGGGNHPTPASGNPSKASGLAAAMRNHMGKP